MEWIKQDQRWIGNSTRAPYFPLVIHSAKGCRIKDVNGKEYFDLISSAAVMNTGYQHRRITAAAKDQLETLTHFSNDYFYTTPQIELAKKLARITPGDDEKKVLFGFSGSDSIDTSIKLARSYTGRSKIISFMGSYHGSTYGALSVSAIDLNMRRKMGPFLPEIYALPYPIEDEQQPYDESIWKRDFERYFETMIPPEEVAAVLIEPVAGDLGLFPAPLLFMQKLRSFCDHYGILLVVDEIQQGFGRTGKWFSIEHFAVEADILVMGKAMASGLPMSCVAASREIIDSIQMPGHLFTLQGNPVIARAALETINVIEDEHLINRARECGERMMFRFQEIKEKSKAIRCIRGLGLSIGVQVQSMHPNETDNDVAKKICYGCYTKGLLLIYLNQNTLRIQPPLIITDEELEMVMKTMEQVFLELEAGKYEDNARNIIKGW